MKYDSPTFKVGDKIRLINMISDSSVGDLFFRVEDDDQEYILNKYEINDNDLIISIKKYNKTNEYSF